MFARPHDVDVHLNTFCFLFTFQNAARKRKFSVIVAEGAPFYKVCCPVLGTFIVDS